MKLRKKLSLFICAGEKRSLDFVYIKEVNLKCEAL